MKSKSTFRVNSALRITLAYLVFSLLWIFFSDKILLSVTNELKIINLISNLKGFFFVTITSAIIYYLVNKKIGEKNNIISDLDKEVIIREQLIKELHHRIKNNLQVVLSLINLETGNHEDQEKFLDKISNKLLSMMSIFNIVYNINDMRNISLNRVIEEYARISFRNLLFKRSSIDIDFTIETITSLLLIIDSIIGVYYERSSKFEEVGIKLKDENTIEIILPRIVEECDLRKEDADFVDIQLLAVSGKMRIEREEGKLIVTFYKK